MVSLALYTMNVKLEWKLLVLLVKTADLRTHCFSFGRLDPPDTSVRQGRIFPKRFPLIPHEVEVAPQLQVGHVGDVVVHAPERLDCRDGVNLLQVCFVFG
jgi:hypothetical protein